MNTLILCASALLLLVAAAFLLRKRLYGLHSADLRAFDCDWLAFPAVAVYLLMLFVVGLGSRCVFALWELFTTRRAAPLPTPHDLAAGTGPSRA